MHLETIRRIHHDAAGPETHLKHLDGLGCTKMQARIMAKGRWGTHMGQDKKVVRMYKELRGQSFELRCHQGRCCEERGIMTDQAHLAIQGRPLPERMHAHHHKGRRSHAVGAALVVIVVTHSRSLRVHNIAYVFAVKAQQHDAFELPAPDNRHQGKHGQAKQHRRVPHVQLVEVCVTHSGLQLSRKACAH
eukprot:1136313-Pelagomonas_calceolata.AAC.15